MNVTVTRKVESQADEADRMIAELAKGNTVDAAPEEETPKQVEKPVEQPKEQPISQEQSVDWEGRYKTLQGKYNAEVPRLHSEIQSLTRRNEELQQQKVSQPSNEPEPANVQEAISKLKEDYGDQFIHQIKAMFQAEFNQVNSRIDSVAKDTQESLHDRKLRQLGEILAPHGINFTQMDSNADFHTWLNDVDPFSGKTRQAMLSQAFANNDLARASVFYTEFNSSNNQKPQPQQNPLDEHVQVPTTNHSTEATPVEEQVWTTAQIDAFYRDLSLGRVKPDDAERYEREIMTAIQNGKVVESNFN